MTECKHPTLQLQSGDFYVWCPDCHQRWATIAMWGDDDNGTTEVIAPWAANKNGPIVDPFRHRDKKYLVEYASIYNMRPDELYGMGKESLSIRSTIPRSLEEIVDDLSTSSGIKHENAEEGILGTDESVHREDWERYIGRPAFFIVDIKVTPVD